MIFFDNRDRLIINILLKALQEESRVIPKEKPLSFRRGVGVRCHLCFNQMIRTVGYS